MDQTCEEQFMDEEGEEMEGEYQGSYSQESVRQRSENRVKLPEKGSNELYKIIYEDGERQVLQITIAQDKIIFFKGKIIYTTDYSNQEKDLPIAFGPLALLNLPIIFNQLKNMSKKKQVLGVTHSTLQGPILILDLDIYNQNFYINYLNIVSCTSKLHPKNTSKKLNYFKLFQINDETNPPPAEADAAYLYKSQKIVIQSSGPIIQKYLGQNEEFVVFDQDNLLAYSDNVTIERIDYENRMAPILLLGSNTHMLKCKGQGWIFFTTKLGTERRTIRILGLFNMFLIALLCSIIMLIFIPIL